MRLIVDQEDVGSSPIHRAKFSEGRKVKILPDGTVEREPDGSVYLDKGDKIPFRCPECGVLFPFAEATIVTCPKCGVVGAPNDFSNVEFEYHPPN